MSLVRNDHNGTKLLCYDLTWVRNDRLPCNTSVFTGLNHLQQSLTYRMPQTMNKYMYTYVILVGCSIRITCPCIEHPLTPHFYIVKLGFTRVYIFFLFLLQNIDCGYSLEPPR